MHLTDSPHATWIPGPLPEAKAVAVNPAEAPSQEKIGPRPAFRAEFAREATQGGKAALPRL
jgi:hypothetical protein